MLQKVGDAVGNDRDWRKKAAGDYWWRVEHLAAYALFGFLIGGVLFVPVIWVLFLLLDVSGV